MLRLCCGGRLLRETRVIRREIRDGLNIGAFDESFHAKVDLVLAAELKGSRDIDCKRSIAFAETLVRVLAVQGNPRGVEDRFELEAD